MGVFKIVKSNMSQITKREGMQSIHSIAFDYPYMTFWKFYNIGCGMKYDITKIKLDIGLEIESHYEKTSNERTPCSNRSLENKDSAESLPNHQYSAETPQDEIFNMVADVLTTNAEIYEFKENIEHNSQSKDFKTNFKPGWALNTRENIRFDSKVKSFLLELFNVGEKTGKKISPEDAHKAMRKKQTPSGRKEFMPETYLTVAQIRSLFARFSTLRRQNKLSFKEISCDALLENTEENAEFVLVSNK